MNSQSQNNRKLPWWLGLIGIAIVLLFFLRGFGCKNERNPLLDFISSSGPGEASEEQIGGAGDIKDPHVLLTEVDSSPLEEVPLLLPGCVGSCCGHLKSLVTKGPIDLRVAHTLDSAVIANLKPNLEITDAQSFLLIKSFGEGKLADQQKVVVLVDLKQGDVIIHDGKARRAVKSSNVEIVTSPIVESWTKILKDDGTEGWASNPALDWEVCK